jgi:hypothetical protein
MTVDSLSFTRVDIQPLTANDEKHLLHAAG